MVDEPSAEDAISILRGIKEKYETHHKVRIKDEAIISAVELSQRYINERFLPDKAIDLMDEAASKLRMEINSMPVEHLIQKATEILTKNRTSIIIAHRLSTIQKADKIIVLEQGKIIESGTHSELLAMNGHYKKLVDMQFKEEVVEDTL